MSKPSAKPKALSDGNIRRYEKHVFDDALPEGSVIRDAHFVGCTFGRAGVRKGFTRLERVTLERCRADNLGNLILRDCTVDRIKNGLTFASNLFFDRVKLRGTFDNWIFNDEGLSGLSSDDLEVAINFYEDVEWALDLRDAKFGSFELRGGIPADKILRDPSRHFIVRLDLLRDDPSWRSFDRSLVSYLEDILVMRTEDRTLLVLDETSKNRPRDLARYELLRSRGFAE